jgi:putative pyruvate formate lyase activating enzyme
MEESRFTYSDCRFCPRDCRVDRRSARGVCGEGPAVRAAAAVLHHGEEPPLTGTHGSGTIFFTGCTLRCSYCQNRQISAEGLGREISVEECAGLALEMERRGAATVNLVSGTPFLPSLVRAMRTARRRGLQIPVVWNSSGYETEAAVELLAEAVDIFLPDIKSLRPELTGRLSGARDYPEHARRAIRRMVELRPLDYVGQQLVRGTIVRHLVLPGLMEQTREVLEWFAAKHARRALLSLMVQFGVPQEMRGFRRGVAELENRPLTGDEYERLLDWLGETGIEEGFVQEPGEEGLWWPDFERRNPFPPAYSVPVWSWRDGPPPAAGEGCG